MLIARIFVVLAALSALPLTGEDHKWSAEIYCEKMHRIIITSGDDGVGFSVVKNIQESSANNGISMQYWDKYNDVKSFRLLYAMSVMLQGGKRRNVYLFSPVSDSGIPISSEYLSVSEDVSTKGDFASELKLQPWLHLTKDKDNTNAMDHSGLHSLIGKFFLMQTLGVAQLKDAPGIISGLKVK